MRPNLKAAFLAGTLIATPATDAEARRYDGLVDLAGDIASRLSKEYLRFKQKECNIPGTDEECVLDELIADDSDSNLRKIDPEDPLIKRKPYLEPEKNKPFANPPETKQAEETSATTPAASSVSESESVATKAETAATPEPEATKNSNVRHDLGPEDSSQYDNYPYDDWLDKYDYVPEL